MGRHSLQSVVRKLSKNVGCLMKECLLLTPHQKRGENLSKGLPQVLLNNVEDIKESAGSERNRHLVSKKNRTTFIKGTIVKPKRELTTILKKEQDARSGEEIMGLL